MTSTLRAAVLAFVSAAALSTTGLAAAQLSTEAKDEGTYLADGVARLAPPGRFRDRPGERASDDAVDRGLRRIALRRIAALARRTAARQAPAAVHPLAGAADYGESGARFGAMRSGHVHEGQDVFAPAGTPLRAVLDGVVLETGNDGGRGNYVAIFSSKTKRTYVYLHMQSPSEAAVGDAVTAGERVGRVGCTGSCWGDHLHFEIRKGRSASAPPTDPMPYLLRWAKD